MTRFFSGTADIEAAVGATLGPSEAIAVTQEAIDRFAEATNDRQWIHTDVERATREAGGTVAHGMLTLSLIVPLVAQLFAVQTPSSINYGFDRVRFVTPVPSGALVSATARIVEVQRARTGVKVLSAVEIADGRTSAVVYCVADWWTFYPGIADEAADDA